MAHEAWGTPEEIERRRRIRLSVWAYAYELENTNLVSDALFDAEAALVDVTVPTSHAKLDAFFKRHFSPATGMWIRKHPELSKVRGVFLRLHKPQASLSPAPASSMSR